MGSFLNVVITRLPNIIVRPSHTSYAPNVPDAPPNSFSFKSISIMFQFILKELSFKASHCPNCQHRLFIADLIPILSYYYLSAKCRYCKISISFRYPLVELLTCMLSLLAVYRFDCHPKTLATLLLIWALITLACIDFEHLILPNSITLPFTILGLVLNCFGTFQSLHNAFLGAILGYGFLLLIYYSYKIWSTKEGLGFGDIKMLAMIGAWLGWEILPIVILFASISGSMWGFALILQNRANRNTPLPFGCFLAASTIVTLLFS